MAKDEPTTDHEAHKRGLANDEWRPNADELERLRALLSRHDENAVTEFATALQYGVLPLVATMYPDARIGAGLEEVGSTARALEEALTSLTPEARTALALRLEMEPGFASWLYGRNALIRSTSGPWIVFNRFAGVLSALAGASAKAVAEAKGLRFGASRSPRYLREKTLANLTARYWAFAFEELPPLGRRDRPGNREFIDVLDLLCEILGLGPIGFDRCRTAVEKFAKPALKQREEKRRCDQARARAEAFLLKELRQGPRSEAELRQFAHPFKIPWEHVEAARQRLGVVFEKEGNQAIWRLPF